MKEIIVVISIKQCSEGMVKSISDYLYCNLKYTLKDHYPNLIGNDIDVSVSSLTIHEG